MLTNRQKQILKKGIEKIKADFLPEDEALLENKYPGPGLHKHDDDNPFGVHRHNKGDPVDGAHTHTPQNPQGEHVHGEHTGMALIDGAHSHDMDGLGWHNHRHNDDEGSSGPIPIEKPSLELPEANSDTPTPE